ncbi:NCS1 family nucleobase:cation symporter-1 [Microbacterium capsulatum]|uniref:NCS1 family nucleobase:cation symporter-1 n=1 Tax=Microbacterium capsulatum TaxID=3041921 RepID=A0ABU0XJV6_9MICO|nr:NCS1 family nucleobase:cation symporter-1 [Microbacterium sp. ASV81]MDQ4214924.1 NCS1 family nucleobase:cation symporter-1 [Microbacterium sp. ASV81]
MSETTHAELPTDTSPFLLNEDLAPAKDRNWKTYSLFAMWMSDVHSIGGYTFAAGLFAFGLVGWQVLVALIIGIALVNVAINWMGYAGQRTGVPYPVLARASFGVFGANIPALVRAIIAVFWYGIQTWLASVALIVLLLRVWPQLAPMTHGGFLGLSPLGWIAFLALAALQLGLFSGGMNAVRKLVDFAGPAIWVVMLGLAVWVLVKSGGNIAFDFAGKQADFGGMVYGFFASISLTVAYFSTLMLNYCDFSRFAPNKRAVRLANFWGLSVNFIAFSIVSVVVTGGSLAIFGKYIFDPVELVAKIDSTVAILIGAITFVVATIGINVVANFVSPAYDFANAAPKHVSFRRGGIITAILSVLILPWNVYANPVAVNYFLGGLAAFLGPLYAIIMSDYYLLQHGKVNVPDLYRSVPGSQYLYRKGINPTAVYAFIPSAAVAAVVALVPQLGMLAPFSWFIGAAIAMGLYLLLSRGRQTAADMSMSNVPAAPAA